MLKQTLFIFFNFIVLLFYIIYLFFSGIINFLLFNDNDNLLNAIDYISCIVAGLVMGFFQLIYYFIKKF